MNYNLWSKKYLLLSLVVIGVGTMSAMHKNRQRVINYEAQRKIRNANPTVRVSVNPQANFQLQCAAHNHNTKVPHEQFQARQRARR